MPALATMLGSRTAIAAALLFLASIAATPAAVDAGEAAETATLTPGEYDLKAAFLFNFARFVEWPADAFATADSPITIAVLGEDPFGKSLDEIVAGETVGKRPLRVLRLHDLEELAPCHILFVSASAVPEMGRIVEQLDRRAVLTVGETSGFASRSGMIGFVLVQNRLRLQINLAAAIQAHLTISSQLLRQAEIVGPVRGKG